MVYAFQHMVLSLLLLHLHSTALASIEQDEQTCLPHLPD